MQKKSLILVFTAVILSATACQKSGVESIAREFLLAMDAKDFVKAKAMGTANTQQTIELQQGFAAMIPDDGKHISLDKMSCKETGDKATCEYCCNKQGKEEVLNLVKKDGKWLVDMKKDMVAPPNEGDITSDTSSTSSAPIDTAKGKK